MNSDSTAVAHEQLLADLTHKGQGVPTARRIYYTLVRKQAAQASGTEPSPESIRAIQLLGLLIEHLEQRGDVTGEQLDTWLLELAHLPQKPRGG